MSTAAAAEVARIHRLGHLRDRHIAEAVGAQPSTVRGWLSGRSSPTGERARRVAELTEVVDRASRVIDADYIPVWLLRPVEALDDKAPLDLIAAGQVRRVLRLISSLESPGAV